MEKIRQDEEIWKVKNRLGKKVKKELHGRKPKRQDEVRSIGSRVESTKAKTDQVEGHHGSGQCLSWLLRWKKKPAVQKRFWMKRPETWFAPSAGFASEFVVWALIVKKKKKKKNRNCQKWRKNIQKTLSKLTPLRDSNSSLGWKGCTLILFCLKFWK